jgi:HemY protein
MKRLFIALVVLIAAIVVALVVMQDPGYLLLTYGQWTVETSLALAVLLLLLGFFALYYLIRFLTGMRNLPGRMRAWRAGRQALRARSAMTRGLIHLAEGHWEKAEKLLLKARHSETPLLNYLAAARAAQQLGAHERRDQYLKLAHQSMPDADVAVGLTQAELQIAHHQMEQALATLTHLRTLAPRHGYVLKLLMHLYRELRDWDRLHELLPELRKRGVAGNAELDELEVQVHAALLERQARERDLTALQLVWNRMPRRFRETPPLLREYAMHLMLLNANATVEPLLREAIRNGWQDDLVYLYGQLHGPDPDRQLAAAEAWLKSRPDDPVLLLSLGRLARRNHLWGKARSYLEASIGSAPAPETYHELGGLLEQMKDKDAALTCYRQGADLAVQLRGLGITRASGDTDPSLPTAPKPSLTASSVPAE